MGERRPDVIVVGAGVIGLTMGVCLAELGLRVKLRTRVASSATTSAVASAMIGPSFAPADDPVGVRERVGIEEFTQLAAVEGTGVVLRRGRLVSRQAGPLPPGVELCAPGELPTGFAAGFWARLPLVDMPIYLDYLVRRLTAAGGQIELAQVGSLAELAEQAPLLVNCAGLGARELVPDPSVRAVRGQQVIVDNPMLLLSSGGWNGKGGEDLAGDVALEAADRFGLGLAVADAFGEVVLGALVAVQAHERDAP